MECTWIELSNCNYMQMSAGGPIQVTEKSRHMMSEDCVCTLPFWKVQPGVWHGTLSKMGNFTLVVQVMHKSYCSHKKCRRICTYWMPRQLREDKSNQLAFFSNRKLYISSSQPCFFNVKILCGRLTFQQIHEASPNLLNDRYRSKSEKSHTPVSSTVNQHQFSDQITFCWLSWQILAWLYETVGQLLHTKAWLLVVMQ